MAIIMLHALQMVVFGFIFVDNKLLTDHRRSQKINHHNNDNDHRRSLSDVIR